MEPTILHKVFIDVFGRYGFMPGWSYSLLFLLGILITPRFFKMNGKGKVEINFFQRLLPVVTLSMIIYSVFHLVIFPIWLLGVLLYCQIYLFLKINKKIYSILFLAILTLSLIVIFFIENREMDYFYTQGHDMQKLTISLSRSSLPDIIQKFGVFIKTSTLNYIISVTALCIPFVAAIIYSYFSDKKYKMN